MTKRTRTLGTCALVVLLMTALAMPAMGKDQLWLRQFGTSNFDLATGVAVFPGGGAVVTGRSWGDFPGAMGDGDMFLRRYDESGAVSWTRQFALPGQAMARDVGVDAAGNSYVVGENLRKDTGWTWWRNDAFVRKYSPAGTLLWTRKLKGDRYDAFYAVAVDTAGNVYAAGTTESVIAGAKRGGALVRKYDTNGNVRWTRVFFGYGAVANGVDVTPNGRVYVVGVGRAAKAKPSQGRGTSFVRKLRADGSVAWTRYYGRGKGIGQGFYDVAVDDSGNAYAVAESSDAVLRQYAPDGRVRWTRWFGTGRADTARAVDVDSSGAAYVAGSTRGKFGGQPKTGEIDAYVRKYDSGGNARWTRQFGSPKETYAAGAAATPGGRVYVVGEVYGKFAGQKRYGVSDAFIAAYGSGGA